MTRILLAVPLALTACAPITCERGVRYRDWWVKAICAAALAIAAVAVWRM